MILKALPSNNGGSGSDGEPVNDKEDRELSLDAVPSGELNNGISDI